MTGTSEPTGHHPALYPRRSILAASGLFLTVPISSCDFLSTNPAEEDGQPDTEATAASKEAPALASRVERGDLPPLADRIPREPQIVKPVKMSGRYGGTGQFYIETPTSSGPRRVAMYDNLMRWKADFSGVLPNVARSVEVEGDGKTFIFHLRPGMKWSDGKPFTAADIEFAVNGDLLDSNLHPVPPGWLTSDGEPVELDIIDEHVVKFTFKQAEGLFLMHLAREPALTMRPRHYLKQFHKECNGKAPELAKEAGFDQWTEFYLDRSDYTANPDLPTIHAWQPKSEVTAPRWVFERNPYYWKVDPQGRQLPYIDKWSFYITNSPETALLSLTHGDIDLNLLKLRLVTLENKPVLARNRRKGGYHFIDVQPGNSNVMMLSLNLAHKDKTLRDLFQNKDFRIGLSHAINRPELIKLALYGQGEPWQGAPRNDTDFFDEGLAKQYTEFDPEAANHYLDRTGHTERDQDGFRLDGDGRRIDIVVDVPNGVSYFVELLERIKDYWSAVGVSMRIKTEGRSLFFERLRGNVHDASVYVGEAGTTYGSLMLPRWYFPFDVGSGYAIPWADWYMSSGHNGEKPPAEAERQMKLYREVKHTVGHKGKVEIFRDILHIAREQFWAMGIALPGQAFGVVANSLRNVPEGMSNDYMFLPPGPTHPEQYFFVGDDR